MSIRLDPEQNESRILQEFLGEGPLGTVLEVGCGDGRLTRFYAGQAANLTGIDPKEERIAKALQELAVEFEEKVRFYALSLEEFALAHLDEAAHYDLAIFSWSL